MWSAECGIRRPVALGLLWNLDYFGIVASRSNGLCLFALLFAFTDITNSVQALLPRAQVNELTLFFSQRLVHRAGAEALQVQRDVCVS